MIDRATLIGAATLSPTFYPGVVNERAEYVGQTADVHGLYRILMGQPRPQGQPAMTVMPLSTIGATRAAVTDAIRALQTVRAPDAVLVYFSGHGVALPGIGRVDALCLSDGLLLNYELAALWREFAEGVTIYCIVDACYSGEIAGPSSRVEVRPASRRRYIRSLPANIAAIIAHRDAESLAERMRVARERVQEPLRAMVYQAAACPLGSKTYADVNGGTFTKAVRTTWQSPGARRLGVPAFFDRVSTSISGGIRPECRPLPASAAAVLAARQIFT